MVQNILALLTTHILDPDGKRGIEIMLLSIAHIPHLKFYTQSQF